MTGLLCPSPQAVSCAMCAKRRCSARHIRRAARAGRNDERLSFGLENFFCDRCAEEGLVRSPARLAGVRHPLAAETDNGIKATTIRLSMQATPCGQAS